MTDHVQQAVKLFGGAVTQVPGGIRLADPAALRSPATDRLVHQAVFVGEAEREAARWLLWELGQSTGARPASINDLYLARGRGECRDLVGLGHVGAHHQRVDPLGGDLGRHGGEAGLVDVGEHHVHAGVGEAVGEGGADPARCPGDDGGAA